MTALISTLLCGETRIILHAKWSSLHNTQQYYTKVSAMLIEDEKTIREKITQEFCIATEKI